ncbi:MAG TPA: exodeoxyribonuclease VII small subunit [Dehalococcoidia bacterium]|nr:exodeoxyribonuclease VII small subunit [Dehalococcoidia bacterium]
MNEGETQAQVDAVASFEGVYAQLEQAVARLDAGGLGLEESIAVYETGVRLARRCKEMLDAAELRVSELEQDMAGALTTLPLDDEEPD